MPKGTTVNITPGTAKFLAVFIFALFSLQTAILKYNAPKEDQLILRQDSLHQENVYLLYKFSKTISNENKTLLEFMEKKILPEIEVLSGKISANKPLPDTITVQEIHRSRLMLQWEIEQLKKQNKEQHNDYLQAADSALIKMNQGFNTPKKTKKTNGKGF